MQKALEEFEEGPKPDDTEKLLKQLREATDPREILKRRLAKVTQKIATFKKDSTWGNADDALFKNAPKDSVLQQTRKRAQVQFRKATFNDKRGKPLA